MKTYIQRTGGLKLSQAYQPKKEDYEIIFRDIFKREYYNNNGPLSTQLEDQICSNFSVKHAILTHNLTFAQMLLIESLKGQNTKIYPQPEILVSEGYAPLNAALHWCGRIFRSIPIDNEAKVSYNELEYFFNTPTSIDAVFVKHYYGDVVNIDRILKLSSMYNIPVFFDSSHCFGSSYKGQTLGSFGQAEVFSFHTEEDIGSAQGAVITTNCDELAMTLRGIIPTYPSTRGSSPYRVINARMSEAQAAMALASLQVHQEIIQHYKVLYDAYDRLIRDLQGLDLRPLNPHLNNHYPFAVFAMNEAYFGCSADQLSLFLESHGVSSSYFTNLEDHYALIRLPLGMHMEIHDVEHVCSLIISYQKGKNI